MLKPTNYDELSMIDYTPVKLGGHVLEIIRVEETKSHAGNHLLIVNFDFADDDRQPHIFAARYAGDQRPDHRWPAQATTYILTENNRGECTRALKAFIQAVEASNPDFKVRWVEGPEFASQFVLKRVGGVFGNVEESYNDETRINRKLRWFCSADNAKEALIPRDKLMKTDPMSVSPIADSQIRNEEDSDSPF